MTAPAAGDGAAAGAPPATTRAQRTAGRRARGGAVDPAPLAGRWINSDRGSRGLAGLEIAVQGDGIEIAAHAAAPSGPREVGRARGDVYAPAPEGGAAIAFVARLDFGFLDTLLAAYGKAGILVVDSYNRFRDGSGRPPFTTREFFRRG